MAIEYVLDSKRAFVSIINNFMAIKYEEQLSVIDN